MTDTELRKLKRQMLFDEMLPPETQCTKQIAGRKALLSDTFERIGDAAARVVDLLSRRRP